MEWAGTVRSMIRETPFTLYAQNTPFLGRSGLTSHVVNVPKPYRISIDYSLTYLWCQGFKHVPSKTSERQPAEWVGPGLRFAAVEGRAKNLFN